MNLSLILGVLSAAGGLGGAYAWWDGRRKAKQARDEDLREEGRDEVRVEKILARDALDLVRPYKEQVEELRKELQKAQVEAKEMRTQLGAAEHAVESLTEQLSAAQTKIGYLQIQVNSLTAQLGGHPEGAR